MIIKFEILVDEYGYFVNVDRDYKRIHSQKNEVKNEGWYPCVHLESNLNDDDEDLLTAIDDMCGSARTVIDYILDKKKKKK